MNQVDFGENSHLDAEGNARIIERTFSVDVTFHGARVDHFLKARIHRLSRNRIQRIIKFSTTRKDLPLKSHTKVFEGDVLVMRYNARPEPPCPRNFALLYEDPDVLVVSKPAGLPVHSSARYYFNTLIRVLFERYPDERMHLCHRLDKETSGCVVVARNKEAARILKTAFQKKQTEKFYYAIVDGVPPWHEKTIVDAPLALVKPGGGRLSNRMEVCPAGAPSRTEFENIETTPHGTLVRCRLLTGRQHQIRVHCMHSGFPIVGDKLYAHGDEAFRQFCSDGMTPDLARTFKMERQALHAAQITFPHPTIPNHSLTIDAPLPLDMRKFLDTGPKEIASPHPNGLRPVTWFRRSR